MPAMRIVITGATGNVGTSLLEALRPEQQVEHIVGIARRPPRQSFPRTEIISADITAADLTELFAGADAVVHLAWLIQPGHDESATRRVNVTGSARVFTAAARADVPTLIYASSVGAYSAGPKDRLVNESWPTDGTPTSFYARHKAITERMLDRLERERPQMRIVRMRPALIFKREAATEVRRLFLGPLVPRTLLRPGLIPFVPDLPRLRFQAVHSLDVGEAYRRALLSDARGAFNLAADPPLGPSELAEILSARPVRIPASLLRTGAALTFALRLQPTEPGWLDMGLAVPLMDSTRARSVLGWEPLRSATDAIAELIAGIHDGADLDTPPLSRDTSSPARYRELVTGVGGRSY
jgi:UDP-glucose 4-epimerase